MLMRFVEWFWRDRHTDRIVIAQWPNLWLWMFAIVSVGRWIAPAEGHLGPGLHIVATVFLVIWAGDELLRGVNPWRRSLGTAVLIGLATKIVG